MIFNLPKLEIRNGDLLYVQNLLNFAGRHNETYGTTFIFGPTSKSQRIASYKFWDKFKFESSLNFKGIQTFM
jgi:hypothetical protein